MPNVPLPEAVTVYRPASLVIDPLDLFLLTEDDQPLLAEDDKAFLVEAL